MPRLLLEPIHLVQTTPVVTFITRFVRSPCSKDCGGGIQSTNYTCINSATNAVGLLCVGTTNTSRSCNSQACPTYAWNISVWSTCTADCGTTGVRTRSVVCRKSYTLNNESVTDATLDSLCASSAGAKVATSELCNQGASCYNNGLCNNGRCVCAAGSSTKATPCDTNATIKNVVASGALSSVPPGDFITLTWETTGDIRAVVIMLQGKLNPNPIFVDYISNSLLYQLLVPSNLPAGEYSAEVYFAPTVSGKTLIGNSVKLADPCNYVNCGNGTCILGQCDCPVGYVGEFCNQSPCAAKACSKLVLNGLAAATCSATAAGVATCACSKDFGGEFCTEPSTCSSHACANGGRPIVSGNTCATTCTCPATFAGATCSECSSLPCQNGGNRTASSCSTCTCLPGYSGNACQCPHATFSASITLPVGLSFAGESSLADLLTADIRTALAATSTQVLAPSVTYSAGVLMITMRVRSPCMNVNENFIPVPTMMAFATTHTNAVMVLIKHLQDQIVDVNSLLRRGVVTSGLIPTSFTFVPPPGYVDTCAGRTCGGNGVCDSSTGECVCSGGWMGANCATLDLCYGEQCNQVYGVFVSGSTYLLSCCY